MTTSNSLECRYLGWGSLKEFRQIPLADDEALIYTTAIGNAPVLIRGFLNCIRSEELKRRLPEQFSENDLAGVIVEMLSSSPRLQSGDFAGIGNWELGIGQCMNAPCPKTTDDDSERPLKERASPSSFGENVT
ncbi:hypothetical protein QUB80_29890 [Chlorogloeopsis sp. ULAP01]|uniref:hypothetical protein n=1 Tax=Chlorogloeopsis sp. ULAP01 TaxID=3056483 RepID=UPI0025AAA417|nr:hypothetical protein [Chlorogloeopsis sp. ULAP01]MDM9384874.1 hypothetical protein [Chlorogloeopsis sp. ULAP01]